MATIWDRVDDFVAALHAGGVRNADTDAAALKLPGVWVSPLDMLDPTLDQLGDGSSGWRVRVVLIAADRTHRLARDQLDQLYTQVRLVVDPDTDVSVQTVILAAGAKPMPALAFDKTI